MNEYAPEDSKLYLDLTVHRGLPTLGGINGTGFDKYGKQIPYGLGPHSVDPIRKVCELTKPTSILEIGFNMGYSSALWLHFTDAKVVAVDISDKDETLLAAKILKELYPDRFEFVLSDSKHLYEKIKDRQFDFIFIDGDHEDDGVMADMQLAKDLNIHNICLDDWLPQFGPGVQPSAKRHSLNVTHIFGNIALATL